MQTREFINGFESWAETHHEVVLHLYSVLNRCAEEDEDHPLFIYYNQTGMGGMWQLSITITDQFEVDHSNVDWEESEKDWLETVETYTNAWITSKQFTSENAPLPL